MDLSNILNLVKEPKISNKIINQIKKKYPKLKHLKLIYPDDLYEGIWIYIVNLDFETILGGKCVKIKYLNKRIENITLINTKANIIWKIIPQKYYIFEIKSKSDIMMTDLITDYLSEIKIKKNKI